MIFDFVFSYFLYHMRYFQFASGPYNIRNGNGPLKLKLPSWVNKIDAAMTFDNELYLFFKNVSVFNTYFCYTLISLYDDFEQIYSLLLFLVTVCL